MKAVVSTGLLVVLAVGLAPMAYANLNIGGTDNATWPGNGHLNATATYTSAATDPTSVNTSDIQIGSGSGGTGWLTVQSGTLNITNTLWSAIIGQSGGNGTLTVNGGTLNWRAQASGNAQFNVGNAAGSTGTLNVAGGALNIDSAAFYVGRDPSSVGRVNVTGGVLTCNAATVGFGSGGSVNASTTGLLTFGLGSGVVNFTGLSSLAFGALGGANYINFVSGSGGQLGITNWSRSQFDALVVAGSLRIDGAAASTNLFDYRSSSGIGIYQLTTNLATRLTLIWNSSASASGAVDGSGTWNAANTNWWTGSSNTVWSSADPDYAIFGASNGVAGTVTVSATQTVAGLTFNTPGSGKYILSGGTLTLSGTAPIAANVDATIGSVLGGGGFTKTGIGALTLTNANTYSGNTTISAGGLAISGTGQLGGGSYAGAISIASGSAFTYASSATQTLSGTLSGTGTLTQSNTGTLNLTGTGTTFSGAITVGAGATLNLNAGGLTWANSLAGSGTVVVTTGGNTPWLTGDHHLFTGIIDAGGSGGGKLVYGSSATTQAMLPASSATIKVETGTTFFAEQSNGANALNFASSLQLYGMGNTENYGALRFDKIGGIWSGPITLFADASIGNQSGNAGPTIRGAIGESGGSFSLTKQGNGTITLSGVNTYSGRTTISGGTLKLANGSALRNSTLNYSSGALTFDSVVSSNTFIFGGLAGNQPLALTNTSGSAITLRVGNNNSDTNFSGVLSGPGSLVKIGSGVLTLSGANTYTGATVVTGGTLRLPVLTNLPPNLQIMPLGDSITYGAYGANGGYRGFLYSQLTSVASNFTFVGSSTCSYGITTLPVSQQHNEGHESYAIMNVWTNLDGYENSLYVKYGGCSRDPNGGHWFDGITNGTVTRTACYPDVILMLLGANDGYSTNDLQARLDSLVSKIITMRTNVWLFVARNTPRTDYPAYVPTYNQWLDAVAAKYAVTNRVRSVDLYNGYPANALADTVHPNDTGYSWMATQWYNALLATLGTPASGAMVAIIPTNSPVTIAGGATLDLGPNRVTFSSLTLSNGATVAFSSVLAGTNAPITTGNLTLAGTVALNVSASALTNGNLCPLVRFTNLSGSGGFALGSLPAGVTGTLSISGNVVYFIPTSTTQPPLAGNVGGNQLTLSWPTDHTGWRLLMSTDLVNPNWTDVSSNLVRMTNQISVPVISTNGSAFYRLVYP